MTHRRLKFGFVWVSSSWFGDMISGRQAQAVAWDNSLPGFSVIWLKLYSIRGTHFVSWLFIIVSIYNTYNRAFKNCYDWFTWASQGWVTCELPHGLVCTNRNRFLDYFSFSLKALIFNLNIIMTIPGRIFVIYPGYIYLYLYMSMYVCVYMYVYIYIYIYIFFKVALFLRDNVYLNNM